MQDFLAAQKKWDRVFIVLNHSVSPQELPTETAEEIASWLESDRWKRRAGSLRAETIAHYLTVISERVDFSASDFRPGVVIVSDAEIGLDRVGNTRSEKALQAHIEDAWRGLAARYPDARCFQFSRVGFSGDGIEALVYVQALCGFNCGNGSYARLGKDPSGTWRVEGFSEKYMF